MARPANFRFLPGRSGSVPRSALVLAVLLAVALAALFLLRRNPAPPDYTLGGRLFDCTPDQVEGLLLTRDGVQHRLDLTPEGQWTLSGATSDFLDQNAVATLLKALTEATGGHLLPGSQPEDRRYEFNGPGALRLTVFTVDGESSNLAIGAQNPVTGAFYGSGAGRQACFPVSPGLRQTLAQAPDAQRLRSLLPAVDRRDVTDIEVWRGPQSDLLERWQGRWWLRWPEDGEAVLGPWLRDYSVWYHDRSLERDGHRWLLADDQSARLIIHQTSRTIAQELVPAAEAARRLDDLGLAGGDPWRRVVLLGPGINPDPLAGPPDRLELAFGLPEVQNRAPVLRRGNLLQADPEAVATLSLPLSDLLDARALAFNIPQADSLVLTREKTVLLRAHRDTTPAQPGERFKERPVDFWVTDLPSRQTTGLDERPHNRMAISLLSNLDRTPILQVLPPTLEPAVLADREKVVLTVWFGAGPAVPGVGRGRVELQIGYLAADHLPAGAPALAHSEDGLEPVGLWRPDTGQLLQIPGYTITTARAWVR